MFKPLKTRISMTFSKMTKTGLKKTTNFKKKKANPPILTKKMSVFCRFPRKENFEVFENFVIFDEKYISHLQKFI